MKTITQVEVSTSAKKIQTLCVCITDTSLRAFGSQLSLQANAIKNPLGSQLRAYRLAIKFPFGNALKHPLGAQASLHYVTLTRIGFAREESLIFFIRHIDDINTPFVTVEYSLKKKQILQCYGESNTRPSEDVLEYLNKKWLPYTKKQLKKIA